MLNEMRCSVTFDGLVCTTMRGVNDREGLVVVGTGEALRLWSSGRGHLEGGIEVVWGSVGNANGSVDSSDVWLLREEGDCDFAWMAIGRG